jgi:hypothetical protein
MEDLYMKNRIPTRARNVALAVFALVFCLPSLAANYPLELASPRAAGTAPISGNDPISSSNRVFRAYPGLEYNIRAVVVGGAYPYTFSLSNAPAGMVINSSTGEISWPNPTGSSATPTITVRDAEGTERSSPWGITVSTSGFRFVDASAGARHPGGNGSVSNPWRTISDVVAGGATNDIVYFRNGTYDALDLPRDSQGSAWERVSLGTAPNKWIAYPGHTPVIDFGYRAGGDPGVIIRMSPNDIYVDGFETRATRIIGFQISAGSYGVFRRLSMHQLNQARANLDGSNASFIMTMSAYSDSDVGGSPSSWGQYLAIQDSDFYDAPLDVMLKLYSQWKLVIEDNDFRDAALATELKADLPQFTYRRNRHTNISRISIGGNMHSYTTSGEINFNLVNTPNAEWTLDLNNDGQAKRIDVYRNTFMGRVRVQDADSSDGPFRLYNNVIVNGDSANSGIRFEGVTDLLRVILTANLSGSPSSNIVDATGSLTAAQSQYIGSRGHMLGSEIRPRPPTAVTAQ